MRHLSCARLSLAGIVLLGACERARTRHGGESAAQQRQADTTTPQVASAFPQSAWDTAAGQVFFVHGSEPGDVAVIFPQFTDSMLPDTVHFDWRGIRGATIDLFSRAGQIGTATVQAVNGGDWSGDHCVDWPAATVASSVVASDSSHGSWLIALYSKRARPLPFDSIEGMSRADSGRLAADLARLVSALPDDTSRTFRGIPLAVRVAYRFHVTPIIDAVVADVVRRLNQEANPLEQHTFVIAERDSAAGNWHAAYHERSAGSEEALEVMDALVGVMFGSPPRPTLFVTREGLESSAYATIERSPSGEWRVRWTSAHTGC